MNQVYPQSGAIPRPNASYPMANMQGVSTYAAPLNYNQPKEVISGYDARINPMTGQEIPQTNFARGGNVRSEAGLASLLASRGRNGDSVLVHMTPGELQGLQSLALAHGGSLTINPETGLPEASFLKKLLPAIAGFALNALAPGVGTAIGSALGIGGTAAGTVGTALLVGGTTALIEGDLKKGLMAGLGAYSGASLQSGLKAAAAPAPIRPSAAEMTKVNEAIKAAEQTVGATPEAVTQAMPSDGLSYVKSANTFKPMPATGVAPTAADLTAGRIANLANQGLGGLAGYQQGLSNLISRPESRAAFGEALGGGFKSPLAQTASKYAVLTGAMDALTPEEEMPTFGSPEEEFMYYTPGGYNPRYGQGWNQPLFLPGTYSRTSRRPGMAAGGPVAFASGGAAFIDRGDGVMVDPASLYPEGRPTGGLQSLAAPASKPTPVPVYASTDPEQRRTDVLSYIGDVNKAITIPYRPVVKPPVDTGGGGGGGGTPPGGGGGRPPGWPPNQPWPPGSPGGGGGIKYPPYDPGFRPPAYEPPAYEPPAYEPPAYDPGFRPPAYEPPAYDPGFRPPAYEPPAYEPPTYEPSAYEPPIFSQQPEAPVFIQPVEQSVPIEQPIISQPTDYFDYRVPFMQDYARYEPISSAPAMPDYGLASISPPQRMPRYMPEEAEPFMDMAGMYDGVNFGFAAGGMPREYMAGGKFLTGDGDGMSDDIKANINGEQEARLADGEFVIPADVVSHLGNGSSNAGAKKLYAMMDRIREARTGREKQAPAVKTERFLPA